MTTPKKTSKPVSKAVAKAEDSVDAVKEPTAEELREQELAMNEALEGLPELHPPHMLRIRDRNRVMEIAMKFSRSGLMDKLSSVDADVAIEMGALLADVDDFAESIAFDKEAYLAWSRENSDNYGAFVALLMRYSEASGE